MFGHEVFGAVEVLECNGCDRLLLSYLVSWLFSFRAAFFRYYVACYSVWSDLSSLSIGQA